MPWHKHKNSKLVTHYGRWTKQDENDFYDRVNFSDWRGSSGFVPRVSKSNSEVAEIERINDDNT